MTKNGLKHIISIALIVVMITTSAPQVVCKAAETAWEIVKNQETPLDEVYFDCKKSDDPTKSYLYGFIDGKVAIIDSDYNLIKKTEFDEIKTLKKTINGKLGYIVGKKIGNKKLYGIMSENGENLLEPQYLWISFYYDNYIEICKEVDGKKLIGLLSYENCEIVVPCEYQQCIISSEKNGKTIVTAVDNNGNYKAILDGKIVLSKNAEKGEYIRFVLDTYYGQECIAVDYIREFDDETYKMSYYSYDGTLIKEMAVENGFEEEDSHITKELEKQYDNACTKWLNNAGENDGNHVEQLFKSRKIKITDTKIKSYYQKEYTEIKYYWVFVTANYSYLKNNDEDDDEEYISGKVVYTYIYDNTGKELLSGRGFGDPTWCNDEKEIHLDDEEKCKYLLDDSGNLCYLNEKDNVENLFKVNDDKLVNMSESSIDNHEDDDYEHCLHYQNGNIVEVGNNYSRIFVYADKKVHLYNFEINGYYFIQDNSEIKVYHCDFSKKQKRELDYYDMLKYTGKITWDYYATIDIDIDELKKTSIYEVDTGLFVNSESAGKLYYIKEGSLYTFSYNELGLSENNKETRDIRVVCDNNNWVYIWVYDGKEYKYYCISTVTGEFAKVIMNENTRDVAIQDYITELGDNIYLYSSKSNNVLSISKKTFETKRYNFNIDMEKEQLVSIFMLKDKIYAQYTYEVDNQKYYGIMDLSGKIYVDASLKKYGDKFKKYANYLINGDSLYDSSINLLSDSAYAVDLEDDRKSDITGEYQLSDSALEIQERGEINSYKVYIINKNIDKTIYESDKGVILKRFAEIAGYYVMDINYITSEQIKRVIVDSTTGEQLYNGEDYIYIDETNKKIVTIKQKKGKTPASTDQSAVSGAKILVDKESVKINAGNSAKIKYSAYDNDGKAVKVTAVSSNTKVAKVSVLSIGEIKITVPDNAKKGDTLTITLSSGNKKAEIKITVKAESNKVSKLKAKNKKLSAKKGKKLSIIYNYSAKNSEKSLTEDVNIQSSDKSIAKILSKKISNGKITVKVKTSKKGEADIIVKIGAKTATTKIVVK